MSERARPGRGTQGWHRSVNSSVLLDAARKIAMSYGQDWPDSSPEPIVIVQIGDMSTRLRVTPTYVADAIQAKLELDMRLAPGNLTVTIRGKRA